MGKSGHFYSAPRYPTPRMCVGCHAKPIVYGDRCPDCRRKLRLRKRRKPR